MNQNQYQSQNQEGAPTPRNITAQNAQLAQQKYNAESSAEFGQFQNYNQMQNQSGAPTSRNLTAQNAQLARQNYGSESSAELAQSQGEISRLLMAKAKQGFEFGSLGASQSNYNANQSKVQPQQGLEVDRSSGQISQSLSQQSRQ